MQGNGFVPATFHTLLLQNASLYSCIHGIAESSICKLDLLWNLMKPKYTIDKNIIQLVLLAKLKHFISYCRGKYAGGFSTACIRFDGWLTTVHVRKNCQASSFYTATVCLKQYNQFHTFIWFGTIICSCCFFFRLLIWTLVILFLGVLTKTRFVS